MGCFIRIEFGSWRWRLRWASVLTIWAILAFLPGAWVTASDLDDVKQHFRTGNYEACEELAKAQIETGIFNDLWHRTLIETSMVTGKYSEALETLEKAIAKFPSSLRLRLLGVQVYQMNNLPNKAEGQLAYLDALLDREPWRLTNKSDLVPIGEFFLLQGEDPKQVLKSCYDQAIKVDPKSLDAYLATARMALDKNDDKVASQALSKALQLDVQDPELYYLLAQAWRSTEPSKTSEYLNQSLEINPHYLPSLIMMAESRMSAEDYVGGKSILDEVEKTNARLPKMWALRAAIAHLQGEYASEGEFRRTGLLPWKLNPEVDYTIGKQLSMHYRFQEAAEYQRRALQMDAGYVPAKTQLAQDLLRLGELEPGWKMVDEVRTQDPYDVTIFNLKQLHTQLDKFTTIEIPGFVIRMETRESKIYGNEVVALLREARETLTQKYATPLTEPIYVEIFPRQKEFAIRTFGLPGGEGFLGVCFGRLITANSPAALQSDSNWKSVLWHEYCHVITLQKTKNKMPRWLSEGISVYEERQRNSTWGQSMSPRYREMILGDDFIPMSRMSGAFLQPKSPMHLQFAYYEASMAVEFWIEKYGMKNLLKLLEDLSVGMPPDEALRRVPGSLAVLDEEFETYIKQLAKAYGQGIDFSTPKPEDKEDIQGWFDRHRDSWYGLTMKCQSLINRKKWPEALEVAQELHKLHPEDAENDGIYSLLAKIHRGLQDISAEREAWTQLAQRSPDCRQALLRLIEIDMEKQDWKGVSDWCERMIEIDPLRLDLQQSRATAAEHTAAPELAIQALTACLEMDPADLAGIHYRLAMAYSKISSRGQARQHVLMALEESPRYLDALKLLASLQTVVDSEGKSE